MSASTGDFVTPGNQVEDRSRAARQRLLMLKREDQLKEACRSRNLKVSGKKEELVARIMGYEDDVSAAGGSPQLGARATKS